MKKPIQIKWSYRIKWNVRLERLVKRNSNQDNAVVSTEESCKKQENTLSFTMKTDMGKNIRIRGEKSILYRIRLPKVSESEDYTGFLVFDHTFCSFDFIQQFGDGRIM